MNAAWCANWNTKFNSNSKLMPFLWAIILTLYPNQNVRVSHNVQKLFQPSKSTRFYIISPLLCFYFSFSLYLYFNLLRLFVFKKTTYTQKLWWKIIEFRDTTMLKMSWSKTLRILSELILFSLSKTDWIHTLYSLNST